MNRMKTVGGMLRRAREARGLAFPEISAQIKIHPKFLRALEEGDYELFSSPVHIKGFLKNYADFLGLNVAQILAFWRREYKGAAKEIPIRDVSRPLKAPRVVITPGVLISLTSFILVTAFLGYLFWQYRSIAGPPLLEVTAPERDAIVSDATLHLAGISTPGTQLKINGQEVLVEETGRFSFAYVLSPGTNVLEFVATNEFGKETVIKRRIVYEEPQIEFDAPREEASPAAAPAATP